MTVYFKRIMVFPFIMVTLITFFFIQPYLIAEERTKAKEVSNMQVIEIEKEGIEFHLKLLTLKDLMEIMPSLVEKTDDPNNVYEKYIFGYIVNNNRKATWVTFDIISPNVPGVKRLDLRSDMLGGYKAYFLTYIGSPYISIPIEDIKLDVKIKRINFM